MDHYQYDPEGQDNESNLRDYRRRDKLATASLIFGILAIPGTFTIFLGIIFGVAAIVLGILSRLNNGRFEGGAIPGITLGIIFVIVSLMYFALMLKMINSPEFYNLMNDYINSLKH